MKDICYTSEGTLMQNARSLCYINPRKPVLTLNITFSRINTGEEDIAISSENVQQLSHTNEPEHHGISSVIPCPPDNLDRQSFPTPPTSRQQPTKSQIDYVIRHKEFLTNTHVYCIDVLNERTCLPV